MKKIYLKSILVFIFLVINVTTLLSQSILGDPVAPPIDFGYGNAGELSKPAPEGATSTYASYTPLVPVTSNSIPQNSYSIVQQVNGGLSKPGIWHVLNHDHTYWLNGKENGYMYIANGSKAGGTYYQQKIDGLSPGVAYQFSAYFTNLSNSYLCGVETVTSPSLTIRIETPSGKSIAEITQNGAKSTYCDYSDGGPCVPEKDLWNQLIVRFTPDDGITSVVIKILNGSNYNTYGNNLAIDDITVSPYKPRWLISSNETDTLRSCEGRSVYLSWAGDDINSYGTEKWYRDNVLVGSTHSFLADKTGEYKVRIEYPNGSVTPFSDSRIVVIDSMPKRGLSYSRYPGGLCQGESITLSVPNDPKCLYQWYRNGNEIKGAYLSTYTASQSGFYSVYMTKNNVCSVYEYVTVRVNAPPAKPVITKSGSTTFNKGDSVTLIAPYSDSYLWSTGETSRSIKVISGGNYSVKVGMGSACFSEESDPVTVNVNYQNVISVSGNTILCEGETAVLSVKPQSNFIYFWYLNSALIAGATQNTYVATKSGVYSVKAVNFITKDTSFANSVEITSLMDKPSIEVKGSQSICKGSSIVLSTQEANSYQWYKDGILLPASERSLAVNQAGVYTVVLKNNQGCSSSISDAVTINVNEILEKPIVTVDGTTNLCYGDFVTLTAPVYAGYKWSNGETSRSIRVTESGVYSVKVINASGCLSEASESISIKVNDPPVQPIIKMPASTYVCEGNTVSLAVQEVTGSSFVWKKNGQVFLPNQPSIVTTESGEYTVTQTDENGCSSTSDAVKVTINPMPKAELKLAKTEMFLDDDDITLYGSTLNNVLVTSSYSGKGVSADRFSPFYAGIGTHVITYKATSYAGCTDIVTKTITVKPVLAAPVITVLKDSTFCQGGPVTLSTEESFSYEWRRNDTVIVNENKQSLRVNKSGRYNVILKNEAGCNNRFSSILNVKIGVYKPGKPYISGAEFLCDGGTVTIVNPDPYGKASQWYRNSVLIPNETNGAITVSDAGWYSVSVTNDEGCTSLSDSLYVKKQMKVIKPLMTIDGDTLLCPGQTLKLSIQPLPGQHSQWYRVIGYNYIKIGNTDEITVDKEGSYYVATTIDSTCWSFSDKINVMNKPLVSSSGSAHILPGDSVIFSTQLIQGRTYQWFKDGVSIPGATTNKIVVKEAGAYNVKLATTSGCDFTSEVLNVSVVEFKKPVIANGVNYLCEGGMAVTLMAPESAWEFQWYRDGVLIPELKSLVVSVTVPGSYSVFLNKYDKTSHFSDTINISAVKPPASTVIVSQGPVNICRGESTKLSFVPAKDLTYEWYHSGMKLEETGSSIIANQTGQYYVYATNSGGCTSISNTINVTISSLPSSLEIKGATSIMELCEGESVLVVTDTFQTPIFYQWYKDGKPLGVATPGLEIKETGQYYVTGTNEFNCPPAVSKIITVTKRLVPEKPTITYSGSTTICDGDEIMLTASPANYYEWSNGETTQSIIVKKAGTYYLRVKNEEGRCRSLQSDAVEIKVTHYGAPTIITQTGFSLCEGGTITLSAPINAAYYKWFRNDIPIGSNNRSIAVSQSGIYTLRISNNDICYSDPGPSISIKDSGVNAVINKEGPMAVDGESVYRLFANEQSGWSYKWSTGDSTASIFVKNQGKYKLQVIEGGCKDEAEIELITFDKALIANSFTPNDDGINDAWHIKELDNYPLGSVFIIDRNGKTVFEAKGSNLNWDGKYNGALLPQGVYFYSINLGDGSKSITGWINLMR